MYGEPISLVEALKITTKALLCRSNRMENIPEHVNNVRKHIYSINIYKYQGVKEFHMLARIGSL